MGFSLADYYHFVKVKYQLTLGKRLFIWQTLAILSGFVCFAVPFYAYGYGVANSSGRTEDLYTVAFATYQANVLTHHL